MHGCTRRGAFSRCYLVMSLAGFMPAQIADSTPLGFVSQTRGKWVRESDKKVLETGDPVFPHTYVLTDHTETGLIRVALFDGTIWTQNCLKSNPCEGSYAIKTPPQQTQGLLPFNKLF